MSEEKVISLRSSSAFGIEVKITSSLTDLTTIQKPGLRIHSQDMELLLAWTDRGPLSLPPEPVLELFESFQDKQRVSIDLLMGRFWVLIHGLSYSSVKQVATFSLKVF